MKVLFEDRNKERFGYSWQESDFKTPPPRYQLDITRGLLLQRHEEWSPQHRKRYYGTWSEALPKDCQLLRTADVTLLPIVRRLAVPLSTAGHFAEALQSAANILSKSKKTRQPLVLDDGSLLLRLLLLPLQLRAAVATFLPFRWQPEVAATQQVFDGCRFWQRRRRTVLPGSEALTDL